MGGHVPLTFQNSILVGLIFTVSGQSLQRNPSERRPLTVHLPTSRGEEILDDKNVDTLIRLQLMCAQRNELNKRQRAAS